MPLNDVRRVKNPII